MRKYKSNIRARMKQYNTMLELARDPDSTFYNTDGSHNRGASHRGVFWNGYEYGMDTKFTNLVPPTNSLMHCVYRAGMDFKQEVTNAEE